MQWNRSIANYLRYKNPYLLIQYDIIRRGQCIGPQYVSWDGAVQKLPPSFQDLSYMHMAYMDVIIHVHT